MLLFYLIFAAIALVVYICTSRMSTTSRIVTSLLAFTIPSIAITAYIVTMGDRSPPNAVTIE